MPLFMTLSGFVSIKLLSGEGNIKRKFNQLIVPCVVLYFGCLLVGHSENFWYLKSLFVCYVLIYYYLINYSNLELPYLRFENGCWKTGENCMSFFYS